jgi:DNA-binding transcriptional LysR family regulator
MARAGDGVAWLPQTLAKEDVEQCRLVRAGPEQLDIPIEIRLFRSPDCRNQTADELWHALAGQQHMAV